MILKGLTLTSFLALNVENKIPRIFEKKSFPFFSPLGKNSRKKFFPFSKSKRNIFFNKQILRRKYFLQLKINWKDLLFSLKDLISIFKFFFMNYSPRQNEGFKFKNNLNSPFIKPSTDIQNNEVNQTLIFKSPN